MSVTNGRIAQLLEDYADLLEFKGTNPFRLRAYRKCVRVIRDYPESLAELSAADGFDLTSIDGIGDAVATKVQVIAETGTLPQLEEIKQEVPGSALDLLRIPGMGPKKAATLFHELQIDSLEALEQACRDQKVRGLKGFAAKTEQAILDGIAIAAAANERIYWAKADELVGQLNEHLKQAKNLQRFEFAGSYRRGKETVGDLDILAVSDHVENIMDHLESFSGMTEVIARGETKLSLRVEPAFQIDLRVVPAESFGAALQYFTGSKEHNVEVRSRAKKQGLKINEWGVFQLGDENRPAVAGATEAGVYEAIGLPWIPPELREDRREFEWAEQGTLPDLITREDLWGDLHMHTTATDGRGTLDEMIAAARKRGLKYIAITDHSQRVSMANGLDANRLRQQWAEIDERNASLKDGFRVLKGIECDILEAGGMDLPDEVLAEADWVLASVHYGQQQSREQITDRILGAIAHPLVDAIAHPTGRLLLKREPYEVDLNAVFQASLEHGKALELNANPARLDLNDHHLSRAIDAGIPIVINSDAHSESGLEVLRYGIVQARRGGVQKQHVLNAQSVQSVIDFRQQRLG